MHMGWEDNAKLYQTLATALSIFGSMIGALFSGPVMKYGRLKCILWTNVFVIVGNGLSFVFNLPCLFVGRFLYGVAGGCYSVFCPKYISEMAPTEIKGPAGSLT